MIAIGCDHAGFQLKQTIIRILGERNIPYRDFGVGSDETADYVPIAVEVSRAIQNGECALGILCCGTGIGMSIAANKMKGIRAACCSEPFSAEMTRRHNDANVLCLGGRVIKDNDVETIVEKFIDSPYEGGRHARRVAQIESVENGHCDF